MMNTEPAARKESSLAKNKLRPSEYEGQIEVTAPQRFTAYGAKAD